jgi:peptide/nickel transport system ATP-binding protein
MTSISQAQISRGKDCVLSINGLRTSFRTPADTVKSDDDVSIDLYSDDIFPIVVETGSGKSTNSRILLGLIPADRGKIRASGIAVPGLGKCAMEPQHGTAQIGFQDPHRISTVWKITQLPRRTVSLTPIGTPTL